MKKIILSATVAAMALTTTASALEDIKVSGQAKVWYETNNANDNPLFGDTDAAGNTVSTGEVVFKLGMTGKQGNVGFGATIYDTASMGLENNLVAGTRTGRGLSNDMYLGELYITVPVGAKTLLKLGKQELDTPLAYTERWNATPNTFNAAVAINNSIDNLTLIGAYVGQESSTGAVGWQSTGTPGTYFEGAYAAAALYKNDTIAANVWYYDLKRVATAVWADAGMKVGPVDAKIYAAKMMPKAAAAVDTTAYAISAGMKVGSVNLFAAASDISKTGTLAVGNTATGFKKTKLPTAGVYTDGVYVAQADSTAFKIKASTKFGTTGVALQAIDNSNDTVAALETTEFDLIITEKVGDVNLKAIIMDRSFDDAATDTASGGQHVRIIASVNF